MIKRIFIGLSIIIFSGMVFGSYRVVTVDIEQLKGRTLQADYWSTIDFDFSGIVSAGEVIERMVISVSGTFTPGTGQYLTGYETESGTVYETVYQLPAADMWIHPFDHFILPLAGLQLPPEPALFVLENDSANFVGLSYHGSPEGIYQGYSGDLSGSFDFCFGQPRTLATIVESWPVIEIADATYTLYIIPEPSCLILLSYGIYYLRKNKRFAR